MAETLRPADYVAYLEAAKSILARHSGREALDTFGLVDLLEQGGGDQDLTPAYAFLEAQGYLGTVTPALGLLGLVSGQPAIGDSRSSVLLANYLGESGVLAVPGFTSDAFVAFDQTGRGLSVIAGNSVVPRTQTGEVADDYFTIFDVERIAPDTLIGEQQMSGLRAGVLATTQLGAAAELLGLTDRIFDDAVAYARQRQQFGRAVSGFQSIQHLLAWSATERHQVACLYDLAVARAAQGQNDPRLNRAVKAITGRAFHTVVQTATQATGAMSFTWEYSLNRFHRRGLVLDQFARSSADLIAEIGREVRTAGVVPELFELSDVAQ